MSRPRILIAPSFDGERMILRGPYWRSLVAAGVLGWPIHIASTQECEYYVEQAHGLLLSGGGDLDPARYGQQPHAALGEVDPQRDALEFALIRLALQQGMPILGICRGLQVLNVACGGTLIQDIPKQRPQALRHQQKAPRWHPSHSIHVEAGSRLQACYPEGSGWVNSFHHQAVDQVGAGLKVAARAGDGMIEAIEGLGESFVLAVQWHPEDLTTAETQQLWCLFAAYCREYQMKQ
ncbi:gamma-glutamyl-gamma-aminobutyrate hydrolase family protein [Heliophilum fasciatum]|uniref:Putative glutamine amidotransferase n=1 Tax=Heliophilum fasciatum TaxID=35700 RepID=A0A4R2RWS3_9FIRM|nr:gamma-glutamyl-gamma-aminobutyrate hydrolase family protein [Heliophilum fasciatum]MCW2276699.1 putative glutamine amidotransferase [Heliophilum fasciatum]TCP68920.1 putative glutamine amidotransferase [Heliophilum fasciatum]